MYRHADDVARNTHLKDIDLCIVGSGAAGIALAQRLVGTSLRVLLLSNGHPAEKLRPDKYNQSRYRGTVGPFLEKVDPIHLTRSRLNMYGGTTNHFGFWTRPLDEADFRSRPGYRDASWPIPHEELQPYYADAHKFGNFGPFNYDDREFWEKTLFARNFDPQDDDTLTGAIMKSQYNENIHDFQLQFGDKLEASDNVTVLFNAHLLEIKSTQDKGHVMELACSSMVDGRPGTAFSVSAGLYTLAMGGIETVRLLKLSGDLGNNTNDMLGRGFMVHPLITNAAHVTFASPISTEIRSYFRDQQVRLRPPGAMSPATSMSSRRCLIRGSSPSGPYSMPGGCSCQLPRRSPERRLATFA
jgi:choline dehydrogenase-like flavoprotein